VVAREAVPRLKKRIEEHTDPLLRLKAYIEVLLELTARTGSGGRTLTTFQNHLAESRPADLARAMKPQFDLLVELVRDVSRTQPLRSELTVEAAARLIHYTVLATAHGRVLGSQGAFEIPAETIWQFCASGMEGSAR